VITKVIPTDLKKPREIDSETYWETVKAIEMVIHWQMETHSEIRWHWEIMTGLLMGRYSNFH
jgi:hypothetical protein